MFIFGVALGIFIFLSELQRKFNPNSDAVEYDWANSIPYFWIIGPTGFIAATATVYNKAAIDKQWFHSLLGEYLIKGITNLSFGVSAGILLCMIVYFSNRMRTHWQKILVSRLSIKQEPVIGTWTRFYPISQIETLKSYLDVFPNQEDLNSLSFWENRYLETEQNGFNFRGSLDANDIANAKLSIFQGLPYVSVEFWKDKQGGFHVRHTKDSRTEPRTYRDATSEELGELKDWIAKLHQTLSKQ